MWKYNILGYKYQNICDKNYKLEHKYMWKYNILGYYYNHLF